jgi:hypothetical protein
MMTRRLQLVVVTASLLLSMIAVPSIAWADEGAVTTESLNAQNIKTLKVTPVREERVSTDILLQEKITPNDNGEYILHRQSIIGLEPIDLFGSSERNDLVQVSGKTEPYAFVTLIMRSEVDPRIEVTRANRSGRWEMRIAVDYLPAGEHTAYIQTALNGVKSNELEVARFVVVARDAVSDTTWIFVSLITFAIILLLIASTLQIHNTRKVMEDENPTPVVKPPHARTAKSDTKKSS